MARKEEVNVNDLAGEILILNRSGTYLRHAVEQALQRQGLNLIPQIEAGTMQAYDLISQGVGIGILDASLITEGHYADLISLPTTLDIQLQASLIYNKNVSLSFFARQYIDMVVKRFHPAKSD